MEIAQAAGRLLAGRGGRSPQGDRQEDPRADGVAEGEVRRRLPSRTASRRAVAKQLWEDTEKSQDYSFNKSHAACYALIAYRTAWLKANHPCEYMAALISIGDEHEGPRAVLRQRLRRDRDRGAAARRQLVQTDFAVVEGKIRFGLKAVKNVGESAARAIVRRAGRAGRSPRSGISPSASTRSSSTSVRWSRSSSAARSTRPARRGWGCSPCSSRRSRTGRGSRRTGCSARPRSSTSVPTRPEATGRAHHPPIPTAEYEKQELLRLERETLGLYVSEHPLHGVREQLRREDRREARRARAAARRRDRHGRRHRLRREARDDEARRADGLPRARRPDRIRRGGGLQLDVRQRARAVRRRPDPRRQGRVSTTSRQGETKLIALEVTAVRGGRRSAARSASRSNAQQAPAGVIRELARLVKEFPGDSPVFVSLETSQGPKTLALGPEYRVRPDSDFLAEAKTLLGESSIV